MAEENETITITIAKKTWTKLSLRKIKKSFKSFTEVIEDLFKRERKE